MATELNEEFEAARALQNGANIVSIKRKGPRQPPPNGAEVLEAVRTFLGRFVAYPTVHAHVAHVLWIAHAHLMEAWVSTPRLAFLSPEPGSGKTRALEVTELLVPRPVSAVNVTPAYLFRKVGDTEDGLPTILFDEVDCVFGPRAKENEDLRALLNAGHRRGAKVGRCVIVGKQVRTEETEAFCPVAVAGLGDLPDTIISRAVVIRMKRRAPDVTVEAYRRRRHEPEGVAIRDRLAAWAETVVEGLADAEPVMPGGVEDRAADVWEPLLAVADAAGRAWPQLARQAAVAFVGEARASSPSLGVLLLTHVKEVFAGREAVKTADLLEGLVGIEDAPWATINKGRPLNAHGLSRRLAAYGVRPELVYFGPSKTVRARAYTSAALADAWRRYLPSAPPIGAETVPSVPPVPNAYFAKKNGLDGGTLPLIGSVPQPPGSVPLGGEVFPERPENAGLGTRGTVGTEFQQGRETDAWGGCSDYDEPEGFGA